MGRFGKMFDAVLAAVAFAEQAEWDEAVRIADGSLTERRPDTVQRRRPKKERRPRQRL